VAFDVDARVQGSDVHRLQLHATCNRQATYQGEIKSACQCCFIVINASRSAFIK